MVILLATASVVCAEAAIILNDPGEPIFTIVAAPGTPGAFRYEDLNDDGIDDLKFVVVSASFSVGRAEGTGSMIAASVVNSAQPLAAGAVIGGDPSSGGFGLWDVGTIPVTGILLESCLGGCFGEWVDSFGDGVRAYLGVRFEAEDGTHFGWVDLETSGRGVGGYVWRYAYESEPGVPIVAGAIPEASTILLILLGLALLAVRRRG